MSQNWYKRNGSDFIHGTVGMTLEERGAYTIILDLIYDFQKPIPDSEKYLSGIMECSVRRWNLIKNSLIAKGKITINDGYISNARAVAELSSRASRAKKFAEDGARGGRARAENMQKSQKTEGETLATLKTDSKQSRVEKSRVEKNRETDKSVSARARVLPDPAVQIPDWIPAEAWNGWMEMRRQIKAMPTPRAMQLTITDLERLREQGHDPGAVLDQSTQHQWKAVYAIKDKQNGHAKSNKLDALRGPRPDPAVDILLESARQRADPGYSEEEEAFREAQRLSGSDWASV